MQLDDFTGTIEARSRNWFLKIIKEINEITRHQGPT